MSVLTPALLGSARAAARPQLTGIVTGAMGLTLTAEGVSAAVGDLVDVTTDQRQLLAEVVAVQKERLTCMPLGDLSGVRAGARVRATGLPLQVPVGRTRAPECTPDRSPSGMQVSRSRPTATTSASRGRGPVVTSTRSPTAADTPSTVRVRPMAPVTIPVS